MNATGKAVEPKNTLIEKLVKQNVATVAKLSGDGIACFCCIGC
ncbi:hypothetical protein [Pyxidicoccus fallax]|nr:hypothetical protein [Pyxidicoccus fallax]